MPAKEAAEEVTPEVVEDEGTISLSPEEIASVTAQAEAAVELEADLTPRERLIRKVDPNWCEGDPLWPFLAVTDANGTVTHYIPADASPGQPD